MSDTYSEMLEIKLFKKKGRGVISKTEIARHETVEVCPVIVLSAQDMSSLRNTLLFNYYFGWGDEGKGAIALGYGSLYNHSETPNLEAIRDFEEQTISMKALRKIKRGEELTISYGVLWFKPS